MSEEAINRNYKKNSHKSQLDTDTSVNTRLESKENNSVTNKNSPSNKKDKLLLIESETINKKPNIPMKIPDLNKIKQKYRKKTEEKTSHSPNFKGNISNNFNNQTSDKKVKFLLSENKNKINKSLANNYILENKKNTNIKKIKPNNITTINKTTDADNEKIHDQSIMDKSRCSSVKALDKSLNSSKLDISLNKMLERFEVEKNKSKENLEKIKKKYNDINISQYREIPEINKNTKYYEDNSEHFLDRVEMYNYISQAKRKELQEKEKEKNEICFIPPSLKLVKKLPKEEIDKLIEEKMVNMLIKLNEKQEKINFLKHEQEMDILKDCTFHPKISAKSVKIIENKRKTMRNASMKNLDQVNLSDQKNSNTLNPPKINTEYKNSHSKNKLNLNNSYNIPIENNENNLSFSQKTKQTEKNIKKSVRYLSAIPKPKKISMEKCKSNITVLQNNNRKNNLNNSRNNSNSSRTNFNNSNTHSACPLDNSRAKVENLELTNISKKESDILKELLRKKYNIEC